MLGGIRCISVFPFSMVMLGGVKACSGCHTWQWSPDLRLRLLLCESGCASWLPGSGLCLVISYDRIGVESCSVSYLP